MAATSRSRLNGPLPFLGAAVALCLVVGIAERNVATKPAAPSAATVAARSLEVQERPDGLTVRLAGNGALIEHLPVATDSFVRGVFHSMQLFRRMHGVPETAPYRLAEYADGTVLLSDPATRTQLDLEGFGPNNRAAFLNLLGLKVTETAT